jgi:hypothetical protein
MADGGGIQPVQVSPRNDYGGGHVQLTKRKTGKPDSMKRGGKVRKGGMIRMHKGEVVIPAGKAKRMKNMKRGRGKSR